MLNQDKTMEKIIALCKGRGYVYAGSEIYEYDKPQAGVAHFIHTYHCDGNPLPSFEGEPERIALEWADAKSFADVLWENLNEDNKVSLFVRTIDIASGETDTVIINRHN